MKREIETFSELKTQLETDPKLMEQFKKDPVKTLDQIRQESPVPDNWIYRIVVLSLGITILSIVIGIIILMGTGIISDDKGVPTILTAIGSAAIGALAGLLAPQPKSN